MSLCIEMISFSAFVFAKKVSDPAVWEGDSEEGKWGETQQKKGRGRDHNSIWWSEICPVSKLTLADRNRPGQTNGDLEYEFQCGSHSLWGNWNPSLSHRLVFADQQAAKEAKAELCAY